DEGLEQARHNVEVLNSLDAEEIVTTCPGCFRALKRDYESHGLKLDLPVKHLSEFLEERLNDLNVGRFDGNVTYHDPCHLGRHMGVYDAPRNVIRRVTGKELVEMERHAENAMCCGNGAGLRLLWPDKAKVIADNRILQAKDIEASAIVTSCPFCKNLLAKQSGGEIKVMDLPELVLVALEDENGHK
ncbi:MAG: (Fe-S)-binding protein, partial [Promethearchaeota archaeon]